MSELNATLSVFQRDLTAQLVAQLMAFHNEMRGEFAELRTMRNSTTNSTNYHMQLMRIDERLNTIAELCRAKDCQNNQNFNHQLTSIIVCVLGT